MKSVLRSLFLVLSLVLVSESHAFTVDVSRATNAPLTGLWWNANESGWGMSIQQQGPIAFVAWYTYDNAGNFARYVVSNCPITGKICMGDITAVSGGATPTMPFNPASV